MFPARQTDIKSSSASIARLRDSPAFGLTSCLMWLGRRPSGPGAPPAGMVVIAQVMFSLEATRGGELYEFTATGLPTGCFELITVLDSSFASVILPSLIKILTAPRISPASMRLRTERAKRSATFSLCCLICMFSSSMLDPLRI